MALDRLAHRVIRRLRGGEGRATRRAVAPRAVEAVGAAATAGAVVVLSSRPSAANADELAPLGEYLALAVSLEDHAEKTGNARAKLLATTLNEATGKLLDNNKSPLRKVKQLDNRGSTFYIAKYWAEAMAKHDDAFTEMADALAANEDKIVAELIECQGTPVDIGGYWKPDFDKCTTAMRASPTFNKVLDSL